MHSMITSISISLVSTLVMAILWVYFYLIYRQKTVGYFGLFLFAYSFKLALDIALEFDPNETIWLLLSYASMLGILLLFLQSMLSFVGKPLPRPILLASVATFSGSALLDVAGISETGSIGLLSLGIAVGCAFGVRLFVTHPGFKRFVNSLTLSIFFLWGGLQIAYPFARELEEWLQAGYLIAATLKLLFVGGLLMGYVQKTLEDLDISATRLRLALEASNEGLWDFNARTGRVFYSPRYFTMLGYEPGGFPETPDTFLSLLHPEDRTRLGPPVSTGFAHSEDSRLEIFRLRARDGGYRWIESRSKVVERDARGRVIRIIGTHQDVTDRKEDQEEQERLRQRLAQAQKMESIGRLAGGIAHDFNNLLTGISGHLSLVMMDLDDQDPIKQTLRDVQKAAGAAGDLTRQLLSFSRKQIIEPRPFDLGALLLRASRTLGRLVGEEIRIETECPAGLPLVLADPQPIEQVVVQLGMNARDAMPNGGWMKLSLSKETISPENARRLDLRFPGDYLALSVLDSGEGIDEATLAHLFEPFYTTKPKGKGTGLGLAMVYGTVKQHGGGIEVASRPGQGSRFTVYLPIAPSTLGVGDDPLLPLSLPKGTETILMAEDDAIVRDFAERLLQRCGYTLLIANDGRDALEKAARAGRIDLLFTDIVMPRMNGRELAERLCPLRPNMRLLFTSGYTEDSELVESVRGQRIDFLAKPYTPNSLAQKVRFVLDRKNPPTNPFMKAMKDDSAPGASKPAT